MHHILTTFSEPLIYFLAFSIVFLENGVIACFFLPGDTLLFSLGLFAHQGIIGFLPLMGVLILGGFLGNILGYRIGNFVRAKHGSYALLKKIPERYIRKTEHFYSRYGAWTVVLSRFVPIVRTVAPFLAGVSHMSYRRFVLLSAVGAVLWPAVVVTIGYMFGAYIPLEKVQETSLILMGAACILTPVVFSLSRIYLKKRG